MNKAVRVLTHHQLNLYMSLSIMNIRELLNLKYEPRPVSGSTHSVESGDNIFTVQIETTKNVEYYGYFNSGGVRQDNIELRPLTSDVIYVSGSYVGAPIDAYALDVGSIYRSNTHPIFTLTGPGLDPKTFINILSSSNNLS